MLTAETIKRFAPRAREDYVAALVAGQPFMQAAGLFGEGGTSGTRLRLAHFMAQTAHETGGYTIVREATNWTPEQVCRLWPTRFKTVADPRILLCRGDSRKLANMAYANRSELGNEGGDDGWLYRGGSFLQATGRAHYQELTAALGIDLAERPELIEDANVGLRAALHVWGKHSLNRLADNNHGRAIGNAINRGYAFSKHAPIGHADRAKWLARAWAVFGEGQTLPEFPALTLGAFGDDVRMLQGALHMLGYGVGDQDGVYGPTLLRAVGAFKADQKTYMGQELLPGDAIDEVCRAAIDSAVLEGRGVVISPERANATEGDLLAAGSTEAAAGRQQALVGSGLAATGIAGGLAQANVLDGAIMGLNKVTAFQVALVPFSRALLWGLTNFWWVAMILAGIYAWRSGKAVSLARLVAHRLGWNLSK